MRTTGIRQQLLRLAVLGTVAAGIVGIAPASGQPGTAPVLPQVNERVTMRQADPPPAPPRGMATSGQGDTASSRLGIPTTNATTRSCTTSDKNESRLGLLNHTAMQSHCDYP
jgi:hypothetical protein